MRVLLFAVTCIVSKGANPTDHRIIVVDPDVECAHHRLLLARSFDLHAILFLLIYLLSRILPSTFVLHAYGTIFLKHYCALSAGVAATKAATALCKTCTFDGHILLTVLTLCSVSVGSRT